MEKNTENKQKLEEAGALWKKTSKGSGSTYLNGSIKTRDGEEIKVIIFSNKYKEQGSNQPDYRVYFDNSTQGQQNVPAKKTSSNKPVVAEEIPF